MAAPRSRDPLGRMSSYQLNSYQRPASANQQDDLTQNSSLSGLTSLENDTDDFGRLMIQQVRDEKRLRSTLSSNIPVQPFRKARKHQSLSLTYQNLERSNSDSVYAGVTGEQHKVGSPGSYSGSDASDPPLRLPQTWGRKARVNRDWMKTISSSQPSVKEPVRAEENLISQDKATRRHSGIEVGRTWNPQPGRSSSASKRLSISPATRSYSPVARLDSPTSSRSSSPFPRSSTPVSRIPQPSQRPATPTQSNSKIPRLARSSSTLKDIAALELESDLSLNSIITSTPAPSARSFQASKSHKPDKVKRIVEEEHCSTIITSVLGNSIDDSDPTRDTLRALSRVLSSKSSSPASDNPIQSEQRREEPELRAPESFKDAIQDAIEKVEENAQQKIEPKKEEETEEETKATIPVKQESPKRTQNSRFPPSPQKTSHQQLSTHTKHLSLHLRGSGSGFDLKPATENRQRSSTDGGDVDSARKVYEEALKRSPTKSRPKITRPDLPKSALEALISRAKSPEETLEPLGESTIDSLEDLFHSKETGRSIVADDDTLAGIQAPISPPKTDGERQRNHEVEQLVAMTTRLRATRANLRDTGKGLRRFEHQVDSVEKSQVSPKHSPSSSNSSNTSVITADGQVHRCASTTEILFINPFTLLWAAWMRLFFFVDAKRRWRLTWLGIASSVFWTWFILEWSLCNSYCRPRYAWKMDGYGIDLYAPEFPFVIPTLFWRALGFGPDREDGRF